MSDDYQEASEGTPPWWQCEGDSVCVSCEALRHDEIMSYCSGCDQPVCPNCRFAFPASEDSGCRTCAAEARAEPGGGGL